MTIEEFVSTVSAVFTHNQSLPFDGPQALISPKKAAVAELKRATLVLLNDDSEKKRQEVEGALYLCESFGVLSSKETEQLVKELYKAGK
jgi:hypothetical protein